MAIAISGKQSTLPIGSIQAFGGITAPEGWLFCSGDSLLRASFPKLFAVIGTAYGSADSTHFNLPDLRGKFLRGVAHGQSSDPDRASRTASATGGNTGDNVGSVQGFDVQSHNHGVNAMSQSGAISFTGPGGGNMGNTNSTSYAGGNETRPTNVNVEYIIKYDHVVNNYVADSKAMCKAWVNFDGTSTVGVDCTIRSSYNVTRVEHVGTGDYKIYFTSAMSNANFSGMVSGRYNTNVDARAGYTILEQTTSYIRILDWAYGGGYFNSEMVSVQVFGS